MPARAGHRQLAFTWRHREALARQLALELPHRPAFGREDFLVAPNNEVALTAIERWPNWKPPALILYGDEACGKTHLAHVWETTSQAARLVLPEGMLADSMNETLGLARRPLVVEHIDRLAPAQEDGFLALFNLCLQEGRGLLLTAQSAPSAWQIQLPDLRSRFLALPLARIGMPDETLIGAVLIKLFADRQLIVPVGVVRYLLARMERSFAAAQSLAAAMDTHALTDKREITIALARDVLSEAG